MGELSERKTLKTGPIMKALNKKRNIDVFSVKDTISVSEAFD